MAIHLIKGNGKLPKNILTFSLPPDLTCPFSTENCKKYCYAKKFYKMYPSVRKAWDENLVETTKKDFVKNMITEMKRIKGWDIFRWHVSGDIYSDLYWYRIKKICKAFPDKQFYLYTKSEPTVYYPTSKEHQLYNAPRPKNLIVIVSLDILSADFQPVENWEKIIDGVSVVEGTKKQPVRTSGWYVCPGDCTICTYCYNPKIKSKKIIFTKH